MAINGIIGPGGSLFGQAVQNLNTQLTNLSTQLATGKKSTTYSGIGVGEGFAVAARSQLSSISAFGDTITNVNTVISVANTALQSLSNITGQVQSEAGTGPQDISSSGQTIGQQSAFAELSAIVGVLNTQAGDRFIFSGSAIHTPAVASVDTILNGNGTQAGLKQVIAERAQADGTTALHWAVYNDDADLVERLIKAGAKVKTFGLNFFASTFTLIAQFDDNSHRILFFIESDPLAQRFSLFS